ncbi:MAG: sigma-54 dependent transcriptional regulator [Myxococcota bacterium]
MGEIADTAAVLIVEDDDDLRQLLVAGLGERGLQAAGFGSAEGALAALPAHDPGVALVDLNLPGMDGIELCARLSEQPNPPSVVLMTAFGSINAAVKAVRAGATDFLVKPLDLDVVVHRVQRVLAEQQVREEARRLRAEVDRAHGFGELEGTSVAMRRAYDLLARSAPSDASVLLAGESGTGKELAARALHRQSRRSEGPFVAVNCSAIPEQLLESELFGHAKGAFTDARTDRPGLFTRANRGTLFLDEIGELPLPMQAKLLRALEERRVRPVGSDTEYDIDVRLITATNRDLEERCENGEFREDLFFRINVICVQLPPLRSRGTDVLELAQSFVQQFATSADKPVAGISAETAQRLCDYHWPGNVRELKNCIERAVALTEHAEIQPQDLPDRVRTFRTSHVVVAGDDPTELPSLEEVERRYILRVLDTVGGSRSTAAGILGVDRKTLYRRLERYKKADS